MRIINCKLEKIDSQFLQNFDLVVVGLGVAGSIISTLVNSKIKVLIIESGLEKYESDCQELNDIVITGKPIRKNFLSRVRQVGGASTLWPGRCMQLTKSDFESREWIPDSGWPIDFEEFSIEYNKLISLFNFPDFEYFDSDKIKDDLFANSLIFNDSYEIAPIRWATAVPRFGFKSKNFKRLKQRSNITLLLGATVNKFVISSGRIKACEVFTELGSYEISGSVYVLATGGIENARVLLETKLNDTGSNLDPYNNIGSYYMDHPTAVSSVIPLTCKISDTALFTRINSLGKSKVGIAFSKKSQRDFLTTNCYLEINEKFNNDIESAFANFIESYSAIRTRNFRILIDQLRGAKLTLLPEAIYLLGPKELIPHGLLHAYTRLRKFLKIDSAPNSIVISHHLEQTPIKSSKIILSDSRGVYNMRIPELNWRISDNDIESAVLLEESVVKNLKNSGLIQNSSFKTDFSKLNDASHHMGTTRMSENSFTGVVDKNCKVHSIENLYVAGSSVFPTSGSANPTLTIAALSIRLAEHLNAIRFFKI